MSELVLLHHNEPMTTSETLAAGVELQHKNVLALIRKHLADMLDWGEVAFQTRLNPQGSPTEFAYLNEGQSLFLLTLMKNSPVVVAFKKALVKAFLELRARAAVPPAPTFPNHTADRLVAADRTFRALMRTAKSIGMAPESALRRARDGAERVTGVDMLSELHIAYEATLSDREALQRFLATFDAAPFWDEEMGRVDSWYAYNQAYLPWCKAHDARFVSYDHFHDDLRDSLRKAA